MKIAPAIRLTALTLFSLSASLLLALAAEPTLKVGDPAPKLQVGKWLQGEPVKEFQRDKAYIVEFWATWCPPCRESIPHLNEIHNRFKDKGLVVIGQDVSETDESKVEPFIKKMGDKMTYRVALDDKSGGRRGKMSETWMTAAGQGGIPAAFVIDKTGKLAWLGHPMELQDSVLEAVLAGTFDLRKAAAEDEKRNELKTKLTKLSRQLATVMQAKDWDKALATVAEIEPLLTAEQRPSLDSVRFQVAFGQNDLETAGKLAEKLSETRKDNAEFQNQLAWQLAAHDGIKGSALAAAAKLAERANTLAQGNDPAILDTLARVAFLQDQKAKAIELEEKAVKLADGDIKEHLQNTLEIYKEGKLPTVQE